MSPLNSYYGLSFRMASVAERFFACGFAGAKEFRAIFFCCPFHWRKLGSLVRAIAKRLFGRLTARAPEV
jgi:hypothetical protein